MANWVRDYLAQNPEIARLPVVARARHALYVVEGGHRLALFTGAPCHWWDSANGWTPLDTALQFDTVRQCWRAPGIPVLVGADGVVGIDGQTYSQVTTRVGLFVTASRKFTLVKDLPIGAVSGDSFIRETGLYRHVLTVTETGLRETLALLSKPSITGKATDYLVLETRLTGVTLADGWVNEFDAAGVRFPLPSAEDALGKAAPVKRYAVNRADGLYLYTGIPLGWLNTAVYPVLLDPDFAGDTADGQVYGHSTTYLTARGTATAVNNSAAYYYTGQYLTGSTYYIYRAFWKFDTSGIPDGATISQVNLKLTATTDNSDVDFDVQIVKQDWSGQDPLAAGNMDAAFDGCLAGTADDAIWRNTSGMAVNTPYTSGNLATTWPSKTGATYYSTRSNLDVAATAPAGLEMIRIAGQEHATAGYRPVLQVYLLFAQAASGAWAGAGALARKVARALSGAWSGAGALAAGMFYRRTVSGAWSGEGALVGKALKALAGAWSGAGALTRKIATGKVGAWSGAGAATRKTATARAGAWTGEGTLAHKAQKALTGAWSGAGALAHKALKALAGAWGGDGALARQASRLLAGAWSGSGALAAKMLKLLAGAWSGEGTLGHKAAKLLAGAWSGAGTLARKTITSLSGAWGGAGAEAHKRVKLLAGSWSGEGSLLRKTLKALTGAWSSGWAGVFFPPWLVWPYWAQYASNGLSKAVYAASAALGDLLQSRTRAVYDRSESEAEYSSSDEAEYEEEG